VEKRAGSDSPEVRINFAADFIDGTLGLAANWAMSPLRVQQRAGLLRPNTSVRELQFRGTISSAAVVLIT
jgi:hypothetical protein